MIISLLFCVDVKWQISQQPSLFPKLFLSHWQITPLSFWKHPVLIVETFKLKVYLAVSRHFHAQPFHPVLVLAFAWQLFRSLHLHLAPFHGSLIALQLQYWSLKCWKSTVLDSSKLFDQICFFCYRLVWATLKTIASSNNLDLWKFLSYCFAAELPCYFGTIRKLMKRSS